MLNSEVEVMAREEILPSTDSMQSRKANKNSGHHHKGIKNNTEIVILLL